MATRFVGGTVRTVGGDGDSLTVIDGRITGDAAPTDAVTVDLRGGVLLPAFADGHAHPLFGGLATLFAPVAEHTSIDGILDAVGSWAKAHPEATWIRGDAFDLTVAEAGLFDARWLDAVVPDRPVWLRANDYHTAWVNSRALELAGLDADTPEPVGGEIPRRPDGSPLGTLREWGAWGPVATAAPPVPLDDQVEAVLWALREFAATGVTWVQDAWVEQADIEVWQAVAHSGRMSTGANLAELVPPVGWRERLDQIAGNAALFPRGQVTAHTVKFFADGVIESGTAALLEPYLDGHSHGLPNWDWAELVEACCAADLLGKQLHIHAIGDAAVRAALDAVQEVIRRNGARDRRPVVAHAQLVEPADRERFAALGVIANFEPLWACLDPLMTELTLPRIGPHRGALQYPIASLRRSGRISFGSDWPVSAKEPLAGLAVAVTRQHHGLPDGGWLPDERLGVDDAFAAYSGGVAHQAFAEATTGVIAAGMFADLVWLSEDPRTAADIAAIQVLGTWRRGVRTH